MPEEIENAFLFHEPGGEGEVAFAVLHAVVSRVKLPLQAAVIDVHPDEDLLQDVRDGLVLEDPALRPASEEPQVGDDFGPVARERRVARTLAEPADDPGEVPTLADADRQPDVDRLAEQLVERDGPLVFGQKLEVELEQARHALPTGQRGQEEGVGPEGRHELDGVAELAVLGCRHRVLEWRAAQCGQTVIAIRIENPTRGSSFLLFGRAPPAIRIHPARPTLATSIPPPPDRGEWERRRSAPLRGEWGMGELRKHLRPVLLAGPRGTP